MGKKDTLKNSNVHYKEESTPVNLHAHTTAARSYFKQETHITLDIISGALATVRSHFIGLPPKSTTEEHPSSTQLFLYYRRFVETLTEEIHLKRVFWTVPMVKYN